MPKKSESSDDNAKLLKLLKNFTTSFIEHSILNISLCWKTWQNTLACTYCQLTGWMSCRIGVPYKIKGESTLHWNFTTERIIIFRESLFSNNVRCILTLSVVTFCHYGMEMLDDRLTPRKVKYFYIVEERVSYIGHTGTSWL